MMKKTLVVGRAIAALVHVLPTVEVHAKLMRFGNLRRVQEPHARELVLTVARLHAIRQARCRALPMDVPAVLHNAIMAVPLALAPVLEVAVEAAAQQHARMAVKPFVLQHAAYNVLKSLTVNDRSYQRTG